MLQNENVALSIEVIKSKIYMIRGQKVMIDRDLAVLYGVQTKRLNEAVRRNIERFPNDFMFALNNTELKNWKSQIATSNLSLKMSIRKPPLAFTEQGIAMLSSVLNSSQAIKVNIQVIRIFTKLREMINVYKELREKDDKKPKERIGFNTDQN